MDHTASQTQHPRGSDLTLARRDLTTGGRDLTPARDERAMFEAWPARIAPADDPDLQPPRTHTKHSKNGRDVKTCMRPSLNPRRENQ
jgi:hypothetical protein